MTLEVRAAVADGLSLVTTRNGVVIAGWFLVVEVLGLALFTVAASTYVPVDVGTGLTGGSSVPAGDLPAAAAGVATVLTGLFNTVVTVPISIVAIRTFVGGETDRVPDAYLFRRIGPATASGVVASLLGGGLLFAAPFGAIALAIGVTLVLSGPPLLLAWVGLVGVGLVGIVVLWLHLLFLLHEIGVRDRGVVGAFRGSWATVRGNRLRLALLAGALAVVRTAVAWYGVPPATGQISTLRLAVIPVALVLSAIAGTISVAIIARAYRQLRPDADPGGAGDASSTSATEAGSSA